MIIHLNKNFVKFSAMVYFLLLDFILLYLISSNDILLATYIFINIFIIILLCAKRDPSFCIQLSIIMALFFAYFIEFAIHYLNKNIAIEAEYLYLVPLAIAYMKICKKDRSVFKTVFIFYFVFNFIIMIVSHEVTLFQYLRFIPIILSFFAYYQVIHHTSTTSWRYDMYAFLYVITSALTIVQTFMGFNRDTRNGIFSVFGWCSNSIFLMIYPMYIYYKFLKKEKSLVYTILVIVFSGILYICTESKSTLVFLFLNLALITILFKRISIKKVMLTLLILSIIPTVFKLMIKFYPKFEYLLDFDRIISYYTGNNNRANYEYGRFEAFSIVYREQDSLTKAIGKGFGSSTPLYRVFYEELDRDPHFPYYVSTYGYFYGFHLTSLSTVVFDGGVLLLLIITCFIVIKLTSSIKSIIKKYDSDITYIQLTILLYSLYCFIYSHIFTDYRNLILLGIIFGLNIIEDNEEKSSIMIEGSNKVK